MAFLEMGGAWSRGGAGPYGGCGVHILVALVKESRMKKGNRPAALAIVPVRGEDSDAASEACRCD